MSVVDEVEALLRSSPELSGIADEVRGFLALVEARDTNVERLSGPPRLLEVEALSQGFAGLFHRDVFAELDMLTAQAVADLAGSSEKRSLSRRLRESGTVIAVKHGNAFVFPAFQFSPADGRPRPVVAAVNELLGAGRDPWGALAWWLAPNPRWEGRRPIDHADDAALVELVQADVEPTY